MYFDAILREDMTVVFNGTREAVLTFLSNSKEDPQINHWSCVPGKTLEMLDVDTYVSRYAA